MTRHFLDAITCLYAICAGVLARCAVTSHQHGSWMWTCFFAACASLYVTAIAHHAYQRDELRHARARLEAAARLAGGASVEDGVVAVAMAAWCCDTWAATAGTHHDPTCKHQRSETP